jgi:mannonate dehydratase
MRQSWRWFGPKDPITLREIRQGGATDIVTALHHVRCGELWTGEAIAAHKALVESAGMRWSVVESVPVHESIKTRTGDWRERLAIYQQSLTNLAEQGITTICYNFMPVLDWTRTDLGRVIGDGSTVLHCEWAAIAAFDLFILKRAGAETCYSAAERVEAQSFFAGLDEAGKKELADNILLGLPGTVDDLTPDQFLAMLARYDGIDEGRLRRNLYDFLAEIMPLCDRLGIRMAIHPDDPPRPIFGLPRIMSTAADVERLFAEIPSPNIGVTLCTGSFGGRLDNDPAEMFERFAPRIHFAHLRNVTFIEGADKSFHESNHLTGRIDMARAMKALINEEERRKAAGLSEWQIPIRPDHGKLMDCDRARGCYAGYSYVGRLLGLAELRGLEFGLRAAMGCPLPV